MQALITEFLSWVPGYVASKVNEPLLAATIFEAEASIPIMSMPGARFTAAVNAVLAKADTIFLDSFVRQGAVKILGLAVATHA